MKPPSSLTEIPDPLLLCDGSAVVSAGDWEARRRPELLELFRSHVYGRNAVERPALMRFEADGSDGAAFGGRTVRQRVRIVYAGPGGEGGIALTVYYPAKARPRGCFLLIVNRERQLIDEAESRPSEFWPVEDIVSRGYAAAAFHYGDVAPDDAGDGFRSGVFGIFDPAENSRAGDAWGAIAAWAWGASRVIDFLEAEPRLRGVPLAVAGHSRGGKAALWCGAQDTRVALTISNDSGCTGAALARTTRGETVRMINTQFPHWFARNYRAYGENPDGLPVDQHELIALTAPRLVCVGSASEDAHADPAAEFRACVEAGPVFALYGRRGVGSPVFPSTGERRNEGGIGYHLRPGDHDLRREDWLAYLGFADRHLGAAAADAGA